MYSQNIIWILTIMLSMLKLNETSVDQLSTTLLCIPVTNTLRARHKSCLLRPDTGPCRADILQWYFDAKQNRCYRFFFGGCQGNGNRFDSRKECLDYCYLDINGTRAVPPYFCSLSFDFGTCFGHYYRWYWDKLYKACKRRIYSGCGGNQNNFQSLAECRATCLTKMANNNSLIEGNTQITTCITVVMAPPTRSYAKR